MSEFQRDLSSEQLLDQFVPYFISDPEICMGDYECHFGSFPAVVDLKPGEFTPKVYVDERTLEYLAEDYCNDEFTMEDLKTVYIEGGVIAAVLRNQLDPHNIEQLEEVHHAFNSPDPIMRQIFDAGENKRITEAEERSLLSALREGWMTTDIARVNAMRLAIGIVCMLHGEKGTAIQKNIEIVASKQLRETLAGWSIYERTMRRFNASLEQAKIQFTNTIPIIEVVGSFPMPLEEVLEATNYLMKR
jgi:hypothetical protein